MAGGHQKLAGIVKAKRERTSAKGKRFAFIELSDSSGSYEVVAFTEVLVGARELLETNARVLITAEVRADRDGDGVRLSAVSIEPLDDALAKATKGVQVFMGGCEGIETLKLTISKGDSGNGVISLVISVDPENQVEVALPGRYALSGELMSAIKSVPGITAVRDL